MRSVMDFLDRHRYLTIGIVCLIGLSPVVLITIATLKI